MKIIYAPVPYGGGISKDGAKVYIAPQLKTTLKVDGIKVHVPTITAYHERREWEHMQKGSNYKKAHHKAMQYENGKLRALGLGDKQIMAYQKKVLSLCQKAFESNDGAPKDLYSDMYKQEHDAMMLHANHHRTVTKSLKMD
jgi:hypothetical protein